MKIIAAPRGAGKTTELVKISANTGDYIVVKDRKMALYTMDIAKKANVWIPFPITYDEFLNHRWGNTVKGFLIDDLETLMTQVLNMVNPPINAVAITADCVEDWPKDEK
jgi:hypothetical protein